MSERDYKDLEATEAQADAENEGWEEDHDYILAQQELEDFAQDGEFENMSAADML